MNSLITALERLGLQVAEIDGTLNVRTGTGPGDSAANIDPSGFDLSSDDSATRAFCEGVFDALCEPPRSRASQWTFVETAGSFVPVVRPAGWAQGVGAANGGDAAFVRSADGGLECGWLLRLSRGTRPLTARQVAEWGVPHERIEAAGRSLLYHMTRDAPLAPHPEVLGVRRLCLGDGFDSGRVFVVEDVYFGDLGPDTRYALPSADELLIAPQSHAEALLAAALQGVSNAVRPLSSSLFRLERGQLLKA